MVNLSIEIGVMSPEFTEFTKYRELMNATKIISAVVMAGDGMKDAGGMTKDFIEVPDSPTQLRTADSISKLKGHMVDRITSDVNGNLADMMRQHLARVENTGSDGK